MTRESAASMVAAAKATIEGLSPHQVAAALDRDCVLIDVREPAELDAHGQIPGAVAAPRGMLEFWADPDSSYHRAEFDPDRRTILYCASGGKSALAAATLTRLGYRSVAHLDGGLKAWQDGGYPVEKADTGARSARPERK